MKKNQPWMIGLVFSSLLLLVSSCSKTPDEEQIKNNLDEMVTAVKEGKPSVIAGHLHADFRANRQMDVKQVKQMLMMYGMQHKSISITIVSSETKIDPVYTDKAKTTLSMITTGSSGLLPDDGSVHVVNLEWRKDSDWKLLKADWE